jgi:hypothetical protein
MSTVGVTFAFIYVTSMLARSHDACSSGQLILFVPSRQETTVDVPFVRADFYLVRKLSQIQTVIIMTLGSLPSVLSTDLIQSYVTLI